MAHPNLAQPVPTKQLEGWKLEKDKNGIRVYSRYPVGSRLKEVKVQCEIKGTSSQLAAFISDIDRYKGVVYRIENAHIVRRVSDREFYYYSETDMPWPVHNRDLVLHLTFRRDAATRTLYIQAGNVPDLVPVMPGIVRVPFWRSLWTVVETTDHRLQIDYSFQVDPGGELPVWLINATVATGPYQSFSIIEQNLTQPHYQERVFSFLQP